MIGNTSSILRTVVDGITTFEISSAGLLTARGLRMASGGVDVEAGGIQVRLLYSQSYSIVDLCVSLLCCVYCVFCMLYADPSRWHESGGRPYHSLRWTKPR